LNPDCAGSIVKYLLTQRESHHTSDIGGIVERARQALEDAHRAEEDARKAFERSTSARARILSAQAMGRPADTGDLQALEIYYWKAQNSAAKGLHFIEVCREEMPVQQQITARSVDRPQAKKESIEVMKIALRVLNAVTERVQPAAADIDGLLSFAPDLTKLPPDELACEVIQRAMKRQVHLQRALNTGSY
jgi:hypothetical protein